MIIDNTPYAFGYQIDNGIPITSWFDDKTDTALKELIPFLQELVKVEDVRPVLRKKYKLKEKLDGFVIGWSVCYKQASWSTLNHTWESDLAGEGMLQYIFRKDLRGKQSTTHRYETSVPTSTTSIKSCFEAKEPIHLVLSGRLRKKVPMTDTCNRFWYELH